MNNKAIAICLLFFSIYSTGCGIRKSIEPTISPIPTSSITAVPSDKSATQITLPTSTPEVTASPTAITPSPTATEELPQRNFVRIEAPVEPYNRVPLSTEGVSDPDQLLFFQAINDSAEGLNIHVKRYGIGVGPKDPDLKRFADDYVEKIVSYLMGENPEFYDIGPYPPGVRFDFGFDMNREFNGDIVVTKDVINNLRKSEVDVEIVLYDAISYVVCPPQYLEQYEDKYDMVIQVDEPYVIHLNGQRGWAWIRSHIPLGGEEDLFEYYDMPKLIPREGVYGKKFLIK